MTSPTAVVALVLSALYVSQGLPSGFFAHALPVLLREQGVDLQWISLVKLLAMPWFFKCLWAPWIDRRGRSCSGHYRRWILLMQCASIAVISLLVWLPDDQWFDSHIPLFMLAVLLINACLATQDVATDALAVKMLPPVWRGPGNAIQVAGYKLGMLVGGHGLLLMAATTGLNDSFQGMVVLLSLLALPLLLLREPPTGAPVAGVVPQQSLWSGWRELAVQPGMALWLPVLLTYKIADAIASGMMRPLMVDAGFSLDRIGSIGMVAVVAGLLAAFVGGLCARWLGGWRALFWAGLLQVAGIAAWALVPMGVADHVVLAIAVFEQMADAMSTVALFACMMGCCRSGHAGADYAVQMSLFMLVSGMLSLASGALAQWLGGPLFFMVCSAVGLLCLLPVVRAMRVSSGQHVAAA